MPEILRLILEKLIRVIKKIPSNFILPIILLSLGLIFFTIGLIQLIFNSGNRENIQSNNFTNSNSVSQLKNSNFTASYNSRLNMISIDVEGAVQNPGVYSVSSSSRLQDGLIASGGLNASADRSWVGRNLNLAQNITDGMKIYIPRVGEQIEGIMSDVSSADNSKIQEISNIQPAVSTAKRRKTTNSTVKSTGKNQKISIQDSQGINNSPVSINNASAEELSTLWGVKAATAKKIISKRPYSSVDELLKKKAVNKRTFEKIKVRLTL